MSQIHTILGRIRQQGTAVGSRKQLLDLFRNMKGLVPARALRRQTELQNEWMATWRGLRANATPQESYEATELLLAGDRADLAAETAAEFLSQSSGPEARSILRRLILALPGRSGGLATKAIELWLQSVRNGLEDGLWDASLVFELLDSHGSAVERRIPERIRRQSEAAWMRSVCEHIEELDRNLRSSPDVPTAVLGRAVAAWLGHSVTLDGTGNVEKARLDLVQAEKMGVLLSVHTLSRMVRALHHGRAPVEALEGLLGELDRRFPGRSELLDASLSGYAERGMVEPMERLRALLTQRGFEWNSHRWASQILGHIHAGRLGVAHDCFEMAVKQNWGNVVLCNILLRAHGRVGDVVEVESLLNRMLDMGWLPDERSMLAYLDALVHAGSLEQAQECLRPHGMLPWYGFPPSPKHWGIVIDAYMSSSPDVALELVREFQSSGAKLPPKYLSFLKSSSKNTRSRSSFIGSSHDSFAANSSLGVNAPPL